MKKHTNSCFLRLVLNKINYIRFIETNISERTTVHVYNGTIDEGWTS